MASSSEPEVKPPRRDTLRGGPSAPVNAPHPDLEWKEIMQGQRPADLRVRIATHKSFRRVGRDVYLPREGATEPKGGLARLWWRINVILFGSPIPSAKETHERLAKPQALAVLSSDALSSVAYGTEEIMRVLVLAGAAALSLTLPIAAAIVALLAIVVTSYQQTIRAYPSGGGSYIVASENLGLLPGLTAASALLIDYVLTVAVSASAGIAALTSAFPALFELRMELTVAAIALIAFLNLRGIRESGNIFSIPTFLFIVSILGLIGYGVSAIALGAPIEAPPSRAVGDEHGAIQPLTVFLILSAFAQGCTAMTGVEAVANGVPALKPPESRNARIVLIWMASLLGMMFLGISFLAVQLGVTPDPAEQETVVSQIARLLLGVGPGYFVIQFATAFILVLAANTAFADFPRLASILARDKVLPNQFAFRGDRLAFNVGVIVLTVLASLLVFVFNGSVQALIPLYAVGVFTSFTLSQSGMVAHWFRLKEGNWRLSATINLIGAVTTGVVAVIIGVTKFERGAWLVLVLIPLLVVVFSSIRRHYLMVARELQPRPEGARRPGPARAIVPIAALNYPAQQAIALAQTLAAHVTAVHVTDNVAAGEQMRASWQRSYPGVPLVIIESPYRQLLAPLLAYIDAVREQHPAETVLVVLPEFVTAHWWENALHNQTALRIRAALQYRPGVVTVSVPYHLPSRDPAEGGGVGSGVGTLAHGGSEPTPAERVATSP